MQMPEGMNFSTGWSPWAGEFMEKKKNRERFSIKFNENDPSHEAVIKLLEKQGSHSKAQFIVNAVLHYVNNAEKPGISMPQAVDRTAIEEIVRDILGQKEDKDTGNFEHISRNACADDIRMETGYKHERQETEAGSGRTQEEMDKKAFALIADTMSAFRNG